MHQVPSSLRAQDFHSSIKMPAKPTNSSSSDPPPKAVSPKAVPPAAEEQEQPSTRLTNPMMCNSGVIEALANEGFRIPFGYLNSISRLMAVEEPSENAEDKKLPEAPTEEGRVDPKDKE